MDFRPGVARGPFVIPDIKHKRGDSRVGINFSHRRGPTLPAIYGLRILEIVVAVYKEEVADRGACPHKRARSVMTGDGRGIAGINGDVRRLRFLNFRRKWRVLPNLRPPRKNPAGDKNKYKKVF